MALYDSLFTMMDMTAAQLLVTAVSLMLHPSALLTAAALPPSGCWVWNNT